MVGSILLAALVIVVFCEGLSYIQNPDPLPRTGLILMGISTAVTLYCIFCIF